MFLRTGLTAGLIVLCLVNCGEKQSAATLWQAASDARASQDYNGAVVALETLVKNHPADPLAAKAQFQLGDIYMNEINDINRSIAAYTKASTSYPESNEGIKALFMIGFVNANYMHDYHAAQESYGRFLKLYPDHELAPSVQFELENLGKSVEEIETLKSITHAS